MFFITYYTRFEGWTRFDRESEFKLNIIFLNSIKIIFYINNQGVFGFEYELFLSRIRE